MKTVAKGLVDGRELAHMISGEQVQRAVAIRVRVSDQSTTRYHALNKLELIKIVQFEYAHHGSYNVDLRNSKL